MHNVPPSSPPPPYGSERVEFFQATLKLMSAIFYQIFIFSPNDSPLKTMKNVLFHLKSYVRSQDIQIFVIFFLPFHTFQIQKGKWK